MSDEDVEKCLSKETESKRMEPLHLKELLELSCLCVGLKYLQFMNI